jgi:hypothetical protein
MNKKEIDLACADARMKKKKPKRIGLVASSDMDAHLCVIALYVYSLCIEILAAVDFFIQL